MARSAYKLRQDVYAVTITETRSGIDRVKVYSKPAKYRLSVSATAGVPAIFGTGIVPDYDRQITVYKGQFTGFAPSEGTYLYVDATPELDANGSLVLDKSGDPTVYPDYIVTRRLTTARGQVSLYGIKKVSYGN